MKAIKNFFALGLIFSIMILPSCSSTKAVNAKPVEQADNDGFSEQYSHKTVILSLEDGVSNDEIDRLAADYGLEVVYKYNIIHACALSSPVELSDRELDALLEKLEADSRVLSAGKDYIYHLDGNVDSGSQIR